MNFFDDQAMNPQSGLARLVGTNTLLALLLFGAFSAVPFAPTAAAAQVNSDKVAAAEAGKKALTPAEAERQAKLADDTAKLLELANELKTELDKSTKDTLSLSVVKKAEEVEKLAKKVREEMRLSISSE